MVAFLILVAAGFVAVILAWRSVTATPLVPLQVPYLISGGVAGVGLVAVGMLLAAVQDERRHAADERQNTDTLLAELAALAQTVAARRHAEGRP